MADEQTQKTTKKKAPVREDKNAVFTEDPMEAAKDQGKGKATAPYRTPGEVPDPVKKRHNPLAELGIDEIPYEQVPLPSMGLVYPKDNPLHGQKTLYIMPMTPTEEDILMSPALIKSGKVITKLIQSALVDKTVDVANMLAGDRNALMVAVRITGYGSRYPAEVDCPSCGHTQDHDFDLAQLPIRPLGVRPVEIGSNLFEVDVPKTKAKVHFRFLTGTDEEEVAQADERRKKNNLPQNQIVTTRLRYAIKAVNGRTESHLIGRFIQYMPAADSLYLREFMDKNQPGIDMSGKLECKHPDCGMVNSVAMPIGVSFFWPNARRQG